MRKVSIKQLHKSPSKELDNLPFVITRRGVLIAQVTPWGKVTPEKVTPKIEVTPTKQGVIKNTAEKIRAMEFTQPGLYRGGAYSKADQAGKKESKGRGKW